MNLADKLEAIRRSLRLNNKTVVIDGKGRDMSDVFRECIQEAREGVLCDRDRLLETIRRPLRRDCPSSVERGYLQSSDCGTLNPPETCEQCWIAFLEGR